MLKQSIRPWRVLSGVVFGLVIIVAWVAWRSYTPMQIKSASEPENLAEGVSFVKKVVVGSEEATLHLIFFREESVNVVLTANRSRENAKSLATIADQQKAIAGCNGGYFDPKTMQPSFLEIADGIPTGSLGKRGPLGALFGVRADKPFIENESEFEGAPQVSAVIQCSPMLVENGKPVFCQDQIAASRTFMMTDGSGHWAIGTVDRITLDDLAKLLTNRQLVSGFKVERAMNLDGGPSSALWWRRRNGETGGVSERWPVRNLVLLVPK